MSDFRLIALWHDFIQDTTVPKKENAGEGMTCSIEIGQSNAYDRVESPLLWVIMLKLEFCFRLVNLI